MIPVTLIGVIGIWAASALTLITGWQYVREGVGQIVKSSAGKGEAKAKSRPPRAADTVGEA